MKPNFTLPSLSDVFDLSILCDISTKHPYHYSYGQERFKKPLTIHDMITPLPGQHQAEKIKTKRKRVLPSQLSVLNLVFEQTFFPSTEIRVELGKQLGMSPRAVQIWFQNKRQSIRTREKTMDKKSCATVSSPTSPLVQRFPSLQRPAICVGRNKTTFNSTHTSLLTSKSPEVQIYSLPSSEPNHWCSLI